MNKQLAKILSDNNSGSVELLVKLCEYISQEITTHEEFEDTVKLCNDKLSSFQIINSFVKNVKDDFEQNGLVSAKKFSLEFTEKIIIKNDEVFEQCFETIRDVKSLLTISNSTTIKEIIKKLYKYNPQVKVIALESRPKYEGRILAEELLKHHIFVTTAVDMAAGLFIKEVDAVFCGVDKILSDFSVVNKIGSLQLALLCKEYSIPFYVFGYESKFSAEKNYIPKENNPNEIWKYNHKYLTIKNYYFEVVPSKLITTIFTEKRSIKTKEM